MVTLWGVFTPEREIVACFAYNNRSEAEAMALALTPPITPSGKQRRHTVEPVKGVVRDGELVALAEKRKWNEKREKAPAIKQPWEIIYPPMPAQEYLELLAWKLQHDEDCRNRERYVFESN